VGPDVGGEGNWRRHAAPSVVSPLRRRRACHPPAQVVFGIVLMGYRELMEGHHSFLVTATTSMVGIDPHEASSVALSGTR
jgi:hypothetical protein